MTETLVPADASLESLVARVLDEVRERQKRGEQPDAEEYAARYPEAAPLLRKVLQTLRLIEESLSGSALAGDAAGDGLTGVLGDFEIVREVGRGGMGIVYEAVQRSLRRRVALKVLPLAAVLDPRQLQRFQNEAQAAAALHHTSIVPVHAVGSERGVHYYAMQFIDGQPLSALIAVRRRRLRRDPDGAVGGEPGTEDYQAPKVPEADTPGPAAGVLSTELSGEGPAFYRAVAGLGEQAARALDHAHQRGVVHRDIKPANLLLDEAGTLWVADFGLAQVQCDARLTMTGDLVGTLRYMSPEQALARRGFIDHRADIYSLGATLYELVTLEPVFPGKDRQDLLRQIAFEEPRLPRRLERSVPVELETIILKALEKNPAERYATAGELADDLRRFVQDEPLRARRPGPVQRLRKWGRRHQGVVAAGLAFLVLAVVVLAGSTVWVWRAAARATAAEGAAMNALGTAEQREAETQAVLDFVTEQVIAAARPKGDEGGLGFDVTLHRALEAALPAVDRSFSEKPLVEARLRMTLGQSFLKLGEAAIASEQFQAARELRTRYLGHDHEETLASMNNLGVSYVDLGRYAEAITLFDEVLALRRAKLGPDHPATLRTLNHLAICYSHLGQHADALKLYEETVELQKVKLGPDHPDTLKSRNNLGNCYGQLGRHADALRLQEETLALTTAKFGPEHRETHRCMHNLANWYGTLGQHPKALKLREQTLALERANLGPDHPDTFLSMHNLAHSYSELGRHAEALELAKEAHSLMEAKLGPHHADTLSSMANLAGKYDALSRHEEALKLREEMLARKRATFGPDHPETLKCMNDVAVSYAALGRHVEAFELHEQTLALRKAKLGPDHPNTLGSMLNLAQSYTDLGRREEALKLQEETLALMRVKIPDHSLTFSCMNNLANSYAAVGRREEALKLREETLARKRVKLGPDHPDLLKSMNNLARSYDALGRHAKALPLDEQALALARARLGPDHPDTLRSMHNLSSTYLNLGRPAEALPLMEETVRRRSAKPGRDHPNTLGSMNNLADCYVALDRYPDALQILEEIVRLKSAKPGPNRPGIGRDLYSIACIHAKQIPGSAPGTQQADQAMDWLRKAIAAGFKNVARMKNDKDLEVLRGRPDFQKLVDELEARKAKETVGKAKPSP